MASALKEILPSCGMLSYEFALQPILCKPKLLPLKSVTLEKLERMQREAQEKMKEMEEAEKKIRAQPFGDLSNSSEQTADVWRPEDDQDDVSVVDSQSSARTPRHNDTEKYDINLGPIESNTSAPKEQNELDF